jgi:molybdopterin synthase sulfur carrier subunit
VKIRLKLYAGLSAYLPETARKNEAEVDVADGTTVAAALAKFGVPREHCHLVLVNGVFATPERRAEQTLTEGDHLAVWPPVAGG